MCVEFTAKTTRFFIIILIILFVISGYILLRYNSTSGKYKTTSSERRLGVKNGGKNVKNKYKPAKNKPAPQNKSSPIVDIHGNEKRQKNSNIQFSESSVHHVYTKLFKFTRETRANKELLDIMGLPPIKFDPAYKNPCFIGDDTNLLFNDGQLHCLPYFYLIGVKKCGTTDLFHRIAAHPEFLRAGFKEAQWFARMRFGKGGATFSAKPIFKSTLKKGIDNRSIKFYISIFDGAADRIQSNPVKNGKDGVYYNSVTAEGTPSNLHMHTNWDLLPGNEGLAEPRYTNFHYIKHINPNAKIIIIFRDPVTRLFSDFKHVLRGRHIPPSEEISRKFHAEVAVLIQAYESCFRLFSMRRCIYNDTLLEKENMRLNIFLKKSFVAGFYAFFWQELLAVFRREQILPIHFTRYVNNTGKTLANIFKFLDMNPLSKENLSKIVRLKAANKNPMKAKMKQETKDMLYKFYEPYNKRMAELMKDNAYLFNKVNRART